MGSVNSMMSCMVTMISVISMSMMVMMSPGSVRSGCCCGDEQCYYQAPHGDVLLSGSCDQVGVVSCTECCRLIITLYTLTPHTSLPPPPPPAMAELQVAGGFVKVFPKHHKTVTPPTCPCCLCYFLLPPNKPIDP